MIQASDRFLRALGALVINFAVAESVLDFLCLVMFVDCKTPTMEKEIPRNLGRKITFVRKTLRQEALGAFRVEGGALLDRIKTLSETRHDLIHGAATDWSDSDTVELLRVKVHSTRQELTDVPVTTDTVIQASKDALALAEDLKDFGRRFHTSVHKTRNNPGG